MQDGGQKPEVEITLPLPAIEIGGWFQRQRKLSFTMRLHVMQRTVLPKPFYPSVHLSVCLSNVWFVTKRRKLVLTFLYTPHERAYFLVFWYEEWLVGGDPFYLQFWVKLTLLEQKRRFSIDIRSQRLSHHLAKKSSIITNRKLTTRFPMSLRQTSYVALSPQVGRLKNSETSIILCYTITCDNFETVRDRMSS